MDERKNDLATIKQNALKTYSKLIANYYSCTHWDVYNTRYTIDGKFVYMCKECEQRFNTYYIIQLLEYQILKNK